MEQVLDADGRCNGAAAQQGRRQQREQGKGVARQSTQKVTGRKPEAHLHSQEPEALKTSLAESQRRSNGHWPGALNNFIGIRQSLRVGLVGWGGLSHAEFSCRGMPDYSSGLAGEEFSCLGGG